MIKFGLLFISLIFFVKLIVGQDEYIGEYSNGKYDGYGKYIFASGNIYIGEWQNGKYNGIGTLFYKNGSSKTGYWKDNNYTSEFLVKTPWHIVDIWYKIQAPIKLKSLCIDFEIKGNIPSDSYIYIAPFGLGYLNQISFYSGVQTHASGYKDQLDSNDNSTRIDIGRSVIFSRWNETNPNAISMAPGGVCEYGDYEGNFISVRNNFNWESGKYQLKMIVSNDTISIDNKLHTWISMEIISNSTGMSIQAGWLAFPGKVLALDSNLAIFIEVYNKDIDLINVPEFIVEFSNVKINDTLQNMDSIYARYPKNYPQWSITYLEDNKIVVEIGKPRDRTNYNRDKDFFYKKIDNTKW